MRNTLRREGLNALVGASVLLMSVIAGVPAASAQVGLPQAGDRGLPRQQCLSDADKAKLDAAYALARSGDTKKQQEKAALDPNLPFDPNYFVGTWKLDWVVPESPLGPEGQIEGDVTVKYVEGCFYLGEVKGSTPEGPFTVRMEMVYEPDLHHLTILETDSRGFQFLKAGRIGCDTGGFCTHYWEVRQFTHKGKLVRLKGSSFFGSPTSYRARYLMSVDGGPYDNFGGAWYRKDKAASVSPSGR
jgi:hypothetical protein